LWESDLNTYRGSRAPGLGASISQNSCHAPYSPSLLNLFRFLIQSPDYVARLRRHYLIFRESIDAEHGHSRNQETDRIDNKQKRLCDLKRHRRHSH